MGVWACFSHGHAQLLAMTPEDPVERGNDRRLLMAVISELAEAGMTTLVLGG
ncbi:MAG: hypothetical protein ACYC1D_01540 [Acidimicrobiales bacterium]